METEKKENNSLGVGTINNFRNGKLTYGEFNQDDTCFIFTFNNEFCVWDCQNLQVRYTKVFKKNLGQATVLYKTNIVVLTNRPNVADPLINSASAFIWDDHNNKFIAELNFNDTVTNVKLLKKYIVAVLKNGLYIYELNTLKVLESFDTQANPMGLCAISDGEVELGGNHNASTSGSEGNQKTVIAFPASETGEVNVYHISEGKLLTIKAHQGELSGLALNRDGTLLATVSEKGTLIRVFETVSGEQKFEFRRGTTPATINNLSFNAKSNLLCASSSKIGQNLGGTIHIFRLDESNQNSYYLKSFGFSGLDYADTKINLKQCLDNYLCGFDRETNNLIILSYDGICYRYSLRKRGETGESNSTPTLSNLNRAGLRGSSVENLTEVPPNFTECKYVLTDTVRVIPRL